MLVWEWLDIAQLENNGLNSNIIKEERSKIQKKIYEDMCRKNPLPLVRRKEKTNFIYWYIGKTKTQLIKYIIF